MVIKSNKSMEPFSREKLREGIARACEKRPIGPDTVERIVSEIEYELQDYVMQVPSRVIGEKALKKLLELDAVAYVRFASVYRNFQDTEAFVKELENIKKMPVKPAPTLRPGPGRRSQRQKKRSGLGARGSDVGAHSPEPRAEVRS
jgi:transcriptional repressor NrdR